MTLKTKYYTWQGFNDQQQLIAGHLQACNRREVKLTLLARHITPKKIRQQRTQSQKLTHITVTQFLQQLLTLLDSGIPLLKSLQLCQKTQSNQRLQSMLEHFITKINQGHSLSQAFSAYPKFFSSMLISMIDIGEQSGALNIILSKLIEQRCYMSQVKQKIKKALFYPVTIVVVAVLISIAMLVFIIPQFEQVFQNFGAELPVMTQYTLLAADLVSQYAWLIFMVNLLLFLLFSLCYRYHQGFRFLTHWICLRAPLFGLLLRLSYQSRFCYLLGLTLSSGLAMPEALSLIKTNILNKPYQKAIHHIGQQIRAGSSLSDAITATRYFAPMVCDMMAVGEETGQLPSMLQEVTRFYQQQIDHIIDNLGNLLEPCMMIIIGLIIGGLVITMYLPVFNMGNILS